MQNIARKKTRKSLQRLQNTLRTRNDENDRIINFFVSFNRKLKHLTSAIHDAVQVMHAENMVTLNRMNNLKATQRGCLQPRELLNHVGAYEKLHAWIFFRI